MKVKIFTKDECPNCPQAKDIGEKLETEGHNIEYYNISTIDGLTESSFYRIMSTPSILITEDDNKERNAWRSTLPSITEIRKVLAK
ncbi:MAG: hypothetical protein DRN71_01160 [Candidatus Nanohalarchaeota archaeon]|nr:MAG: hypothetical protein DRN71_01160 [Candidatus Nanohaloarchaeota archaeon]